MELEHGGTLQVQGTAAGFQTIAEGNSRPLSPSPPWIAPILAERAQPRAHEIVARIHQAANICKLPTIVTPLTYFVAGWLNKLYAGASQPEPVLFLITASGDPPLFSFFPPRVRHRHRNLSQ